MPLKHTQIWKLSQQWSYMVWLFPWYLFDGKLFGFNLIIPVITSLYRINLIYKSWHGLSEPCNNSKKSSCSPVKAWEHCFEDFQTFPWCQQKHPSRDSFKNQDGNPSFPVLSHFHTITLNRNVLNGSCRYCKGVVLMHLKNTIDYSLILICILEGLVNFQHYVLTFNSHDQNWITNTLKDCVAILYGS